MSIVLGIMAGGVVAFALLLAYSRAIHWMRDNRKTHYAFESRDTYLLLKLHGPLGDGENTLVTMRTLREALLLKVAGMTSGRALVYVSGLRVANQRAFWLLIGALGPMLLNETVNVAVVGGRGTRVAKHFRESGLLVCLPSIREGERYLHSGETRPQMTLDAEYVNSLLTPGRRRAA
jgi:hypothetical protein